MPRTTQPLIDLCLAEVSNWYKNDSLPLEEVFPDLHPGNAIRGLRLREGLTQEQLARLLGIKRTNLSEMENGKRPIGKNMAKRLAQVLKTDYKVFL